MYAHQSTRVPPGPLSVCFWIGYNHKFSPLQLPRPILGGRPTVGHVALDHSIGVRIPASQPIQDLIVPREINEHDIRVFLHALEDDLTAIWRNVEIPNVEVGRQVRQLTFRSRF